MKAKILMSSFLFIYFFERFAFTLISFLFSDTWKIFWNANMGINACEVGARKEVTGNGGGR